MRDKDLVRLEESLRDFIMEEYDNPRDRQLGGSDSYRYRGLSIYITPSKVSIPNYRVQIGILEAVFNIADGAKTSGSLGGQDERVIQKWHSRSNIKNMMMDIWGRKTPERQIKLTPFDYT